MQTIGGDALRGHLELLVLAALQGEPAHGYEIAQRLLAKSDGAFDIQEGSLYPALHRMERSKLVSSRWAQGERGPRRRVYKLTARGERELSGQRVEWRALVEAITSVVDAESGLAT
jgi:PadR family transcriptional regulator, regulatory protein PadR